MIIQPKCVVTLAYILRLDDGKIVEQAEANSPFSFIPGIGQTLPAFDQQLLGIEEGELFEFVLSANEGFGERNEEMIVNVPKDVFKNAPPGSLELFKTLPMLDADGNTLFGVITAIGEEAVTMDFNHPLSGEKLHFQGKVLNVRAATPSEMEVGKSGGFQEENN